MNRSVYTEVLFVLQPIFKLKDYPFSAVCGHYVCSYLPCLELWTTQGQTMLC